MSGAASNGSAPNSRSSHRRAPCIAECFMCGAQSQELPDQATADDWLAAHVTECPEGDPDDA